MTARTHTEVYRRFEGQLGRTPLRFWALAAAGIRIGLRPKLPLLLLYTPPAIATVVFSFLVYGRYAAEAGVDAIGGIEGGMAKAMANRALQQLEVKNQIARFHEGMAWFSLLATSWFGCGLFAEDRRSGAHQLYFARPLTKLDYFLGKLATACFFSACALTLPGIVILSVAAFASPEWSFVTEQWDVILKTFAYSSTWVLFTATAALAVSSVVPRRIFGLVAMFAFFVISFGAAAVLGELIGPDFLVVSPILDMWTFGSWLFDVRKIVSEVPDAPAMWALAGMFTVLLAVIGLRLRKLEVVA